MSSLHPRLDFLPPLPGWQDLDDVTNMVRSGQVEPARLLELFKEVEPQLYRFPAIEPSRLRAAVESLDEKD